MILKGVVGDRGNVIILSNGARLVFSRSDCAGLVMPGDSVILDTERSPSIRSAKGAAAWNPVTEVK